MDKLIAAICKNPWVKLIELNPTNILRWIAYDDNEKFTPLDVGGVFYIRRKPDSGTYRFHIERSNVKISIPINVTDTQKVDWFTIPCYHGERELVDGISRYSTMLDGDAHLTKCKKCGRMI